MKHRSIGLNESYNVTNMVVMTTDDDDDDDKRVCYNVALSIKTARTRNKSLKSTITVKSRSSQGNETTMKISAIGLREFRDPRSVGRPYVYPIIT